MYRAHRILHPAGIQAGYTLSKEKYQKEQMWISVRKKTVATMRPVSPAEVNNQKLEDICQPRGWRALISHIKKTTVLCGTPSGRRTLWSCWKWLFIMVENQGTRRQWVRNFAPSPSLPDQTENLLPFQLSQQPAPAAITSGAGRKPECNDFYHLLVGIVNHFECLCDTFRFL